MELMLDRGRRLAARARATVNGNGVGTFSVGEGSQGDFLNDHRTIKLNDAQDSSKYCHNSIYTAKYSIFTFFPKFLKEQLRRYSNLFFIAIAGFQQIPDISPTGRFTTLTPLICIMVVSAIKEIVEDYKRHVADNEINNEREVKVLKSHLWKVVKWCEVKVGDIVQVKNDDFFPCDLVLLSSSEPQAVCFVETANLDGETNLKIRQGLPWTANLNDVQELSKLTGTLECEQPNKHLYSFTGNLNEDSRQPAPLCIDQLLLRGARLKNTKWVYGLAIYTGRETKLMKNSLSSAPLKRSTVDKKTNHLIILLFCLLMILCAIMTIASSQFPVEKHWYINIGKSKVLNHGMNFITFAILLNNLIPISLQVTLEVVRFIQAGFINMDKEMIHQKENGKGEIWAKARTSNLNEELGMVKYVLSDKTGTLTCNIMEFKSCSINGKIYCMDDRTKDDLKNLLISEQADSAQAKSFLTMMAVCHTVIPDTNSEGGQLIYHAASPDERALVEGARQLGFTFTTRTPEYCIINVAEYEGSRSERYDVLNVLEFTSARKRMSVIVRTPERKIKLYCKGADNVIYERLKENHDQRKKDEVIEILEKFAEEGLRTLCYAEAEIPEEFYKEWNEGYKKASTDMQDRDRKLADSAQLIENKLTLLGATAIEDRLQDKVPETIANLLEAGIHVWVLTGDKQETAINIGHSCRLLNKDMRQFKLNTDTLDKTRQKLQELILAFGNQLGCENDSALIVDGNSLTYCLTPELSGDFLNVCISCKSIICCRCSPSQKAEVVKLITNRTNDITLAIGDGANDVAMIQAANVGIGISGQEGLQAANSSDYSIGQFRFLTRLLFIHGAWNYSRLCKVILYSFYKNICLYIIEIWWAVISAWSGQVIFERWSIGMYNVFFTSLQPLAMGIFDRSCSEKLRTENPELYKESQNGSQFNFRIFLWWIFKALVHSALVFVLPYLAMTQDVAWSDGKVGGYLMTGNMIYTYVVIIVSLKAGLETDSWTIISHLSIWGSIALWFLFLLIYAQAWPSLGLGADMTKIYEQVFSSPVFWFGLILIPLTCLLPDFVAKVMHNTIAKPKTQLVRESQNSAKLNNGNRLKNRLLKRVLCSTMSNDPDIELAPTHGYAFSQTEGGVMSQGEIIRQYNTTQPAHGVN